MTKEKINKVKIECGCGNNIGNKSKAGFIVCVMCGSMAIPATEKKTD